MRSTTTDPLLDDAMHDETHLQCGCGAKVYYATRLECEMALRSQQQMALRTSEADTAKIPQEGTLPRQNTAGRASEPNVRPLPMPDMCLVDSRKLSEPSNRDTLQDKDRDSGRQLQTSFITFKPQPPPTSPCRGCTQYEQRPTLRRADKSSSALPHYGKLTRNGNIEELAAPSDSAQLAMLDKRDCVECIQERRASRGDMTESGNKSV